MEGSPHQGLLRSVEISQRLICLVGSMGTRVFMQEQQWEVLEHSPYSPDLAPSDFYLFGPLKHHLSAEHFPDVEVTAWFRQQPKEFYAAVFQGLVKRWDKFLNVQGDYAEK
jgi:histone-lysine N-methyltransferase SETMAR